MEKDNKLIAEFMELPTEVFNCGNLNYYFKEFNSGTWYEEHELSYNISWDWLMPVVEKCLTIDSLKRVINNELIACNTDEIYKMIIKNALITRNIDEVYKSVVELIKIYNTKKKGE